MVEAAKSKLEVAGVDEKIQRVTTDSGYSSNENVADPEGADIDPYIATERPKHNEKVESRA